MSLWDVVFTRVAPQAASKALLLQQLKNKGIPTSAIDEACLAELAAQNVARARETAPANHQGGHTALVSCTAEVAERLAEIYCLRTPDTNESRRRKEARGELLAILRKHGVLAPSR